MMKYLLALSIFLSLLVTTGFIATRDREYTISITFPESNSIVFKDTIQRFLDIDARDCGWSTMLIKYTNKYEFDQYQTSDCHIGDSLLYSDILLTKKNSTTVDTISKGIYRYGCGLKRDFLRTLKGDYSLKIIPRNKLFKPFETSITINPKEILEKGRYIKVWLGNHAKTYTFKLSSGKRLTHHEKHLLRVFLWEHGIRGFCGEGPIHVGINVKYDYVGSGRTVRIEQLK